VTTAPTWHQSRVKQLPTFFWSLYSPPMMNRPAPPAKCVP